ncbi:winged helix-turn-helix transcriptional regulator [Candidatus Endomicrobiellum devescovinae]|jgi:DNA-binding HxlR family transcriptional regulator|uniref:winged helix-turn-helix transcriptional regulator n=1 Tax=Candidatus Endomicrobiellum devescovinae TaxID=3242322 RepID=UPI0028346D1C|nr:helix-turn-helix transcriptional regulator [Endomicrobium sp.]MDR2427791.1 helix-turn-helix transcriptional regulator [Endomicrobium sp.]
MKKRQDLLFCPMKAAVQIIGNKWKMLILWNIIKDKNRFGEIRKTIGTISQKVLTQNLRMLEKDKIISRKVYAEVPPRVEYTLTKLGSTLKPVIESMVAWGEKYCNNKHNK